MPKFLIDPFINHGSFIILSPKPFKQNYAKYSVVRPQLPYHLPGGLGFVVVDEIMVRLSWFWIRSRDKIMDPDPVCPERLDPEPVNIRPYPKPCL